MTASKLKFDETMNRIVIDFMILFVIMVISLLVLGTSMENGDINAGSMLAVVYLLPLIPLILISLILIELCRRLLRYGTQWIASLTPILLLTCLFWLKRFDIYMLTALIFVIVVYSLLKSTFRKLVA